MAQVTDTVEVRWFQTGPIPEVISAWFRRGPLPPVTESRTDLYLDLPNRDDLGVKVRAGTLLELKLRTGVHTEFELSPGFDGRVESWTKWSFDSDSQETGPKTGDARWLSVEKRRQTRLYAVASEAGSSLAVPSLEDVAENACAAELVEVRVGVDLAWGIGFEAFGAGGSLGDVLVAGVKAFAADTPLEALAFERGDSYSYPAFLARWPV